MNRLRVIVTAMFGKMFENNLFLIVSNHQFFDSIKFFKVQNQQQILFILHEKIHLEFYAHHITLSVALHKVSVFNMMKWLLKSVKFIHYLTVLLFPEGKHKIVDFYRGSIMGLFLVHFFNFHHFLEN